MVRRKRENREYRFCFIALVFKITWQFYLKIIIHFEMHLFGFLPGHHVLHEFEVEFWKGCPWGNSQILTGLD